MTAVDTAEGYQLSTEGDGPGDGIGEEQTLGCMKGGNLENGGDPQNPQAADTQNGNDHGFHGSTHAPQGTGGYIHQAAEEIGQTHKG